MSISQGKCVVLVLLDFANAFGSVDHSILLQTLGGIGVGDMAMKWYESFLSGWKQVVKFNGKLSEPGTINRGIIQGENNSQLLFSIFINNIVGYITSSKILYADDVQLYIESSIGDLNRTIDMMNEEMRNVERFGREFGISINPNKSEAIIISSKRKLHSIDYQNLPSI